MNCSICDTPLPANSRYCMTCGADLSDPEVSTRTRAAVKELFEAIRTAVEGHYEVTDMLGKGGMGAVFRAEDLKLGRTVAIKVLRPELAGDRSYIGRFEREARIAARLDHPNIIPVYAVEEVDGLNYFVMKYIAGKSLEELLTGEPWPIEQTRQLLWQVACGLGHAHQRSVIHRDVKPSNIMIDESGRAIVTDFGISKALLHETQFTSTGQVVGTPRYVSPEQAQSLPLDGRSDQYSLAVVGYQMLIGRLPFIAEAPHAILFKHIYEAPPSARAARPEVPAELSDALQRAMAKEPEDRFATMEEFATAIWPERPVHAGQPTPTVPGFADLARMITSRRPRGALLAGVAAGIAVAALALTFMLGKNDRSAAPEDTAAMSSAGADSAAPAPVPSDRQPISAATVESVVVTPPKDTATQVAPAIPQPPPVSADTATLPKATAPAQRKRPPARRPTPAATAPEPAPPPAVQQVGFLTVNTVPYGSVSIDGVEVGDTPIVRRRLTPGEHTVKITRPGYRPESATVTITTDNEVRFSRTLIRDEK
jgi:serine/threonine-protein kinase